MKNIVFTAISFFSLSINAFASDIEAGTYYPENLHTANSEADFPFIIQSKDSDTFKFLIGGANWEPTQVELVKYNEGIYKYENAKTDCYVYLTKVGEDRFILTQRGSCTESFSGDSFLQGMSGIFYKYN